ncbi:hypothetical protein HK100_005973 [Physocladia obscura]|uniref:F-box domain-containing protein n=1 Tax=Physocladia obscura TaxID=109957 RepID=A0AAD5X915_9FUNG|nr:hypothetical protein HK100_005973 [Physocladia obscura]
MTQEGSNMSELENNINKINFSELPADVATDILSWIPTQKVTIIRRVSRAFYTCISTQQFALINLTRFVPHNQRTKQQTGEVSEWELLLFTMPTSFQAHGFSIIFEQMQEIFWVNDPAFRHPFFTDALVIPAAICNALALKHLTMSGCDLYGAAEVTCHDGIVSELFQLHNLVTLNLSGNKFRGGSIPHMVGNLSLLVVLNLSSSQLGGELPRELFDCLMLESLNLELNELVGCIPNAIGRCERLKSVNLSRNGLTGDIPVELFNCTDLRRLDLSSNQLTGHIPAEIGECKLLLLVKLTGNLLSGELLDHFKNSFLFDV